MFLRTFRAFPRTILRASFERKVGHLRFCAFTLRLILIGNLERVDNLCINSLYLYASGGKMSRGKTTVYHRQEELLMAGTPIHFTRHIRRIQTPPLPPTRKLIKITTSLMNGFTSNGPKTECLKADCLLWMHRCWMKRVTNVIVRFSCYETNSGSHQYCKEHVSQGLWQNTIRISQGRLNRCFLIL